jgi:phosphate transport system substrate-binding protein
MSRILLVCALSVLLCSCATKKENLPQESANSGTFELVADEAIKPAIDSLVEGFNIDYPDAKVTVRYKNATEALDDLLQHRARLVIIARALNPKERATLISQKVDLPEWEIALNPIACITNAKNPQDSISIDELRLVLKGKNTSYQKVLASNLGSTEGILDSIFLQDTGVIRGTAIRFATSDSIISKVRDDSRTIGFVSATWLQKDNASVKALRISNGGKAMMLHLAYVYQEIYPLVGRVMGYTFEAANSLPRGFLAYVMAAEGQRVLLNHQLLPRTQIIKLTPPVE